MTRSALLSSLLLAAAVSVDLAGFNRAGPAQWVPVALLTSQCGLLAFLLLIVPGRPLARAAFLLGTLAAMSAVFQVPPDLVARLLAVNAAAAMAVVAAGYRCSVGETDLSTRNHNTRTVTMKIISATRPPQFSLAQLLFLVTLVSLFFGFARLWPPQPSQSLDLPLLVTAAFAAITLLATTIVLARRPCRRAVGMFCFAVIGISGMFLRIQYPRLGWWGFALLGLHVTLVMAMLLVLRTAGLRIERRPLLGRAFDHGNLAREIPH